jgi:hypothetical protein
MARALGRVLADWCCRPLLAEQLPADENWVRCWVGASWHGRGNPVLRFGTEGWVGFLRQPSANFREQVRRRPRKPAREHEVRYRLVDRGRESAPCRSRTAIRQAAEVRMTEYRLLRGGEQYRYRFATADPVLETVGVPHGPVAGIGLPLLDVLRTARGPLGQISRRSTGRRFHR